MGLENEFNPVPKKRKMIKVSCDRCGLELERRSDQINQRGTGTFCKPCCNKMTSERLKEENPNKKRGNHINCRQCGKEFYINQGRINSRKFCSKPCQYKWHSDRMHPNFIANTLSGENTPTYKHGKRVGKAISKPALRREIIKRDNGNWCLFCGKPAPGLHIHRVIYGSHGGKYELTNCVLLCGEHHGLVHSNKKTWQQPLLDYLSEKITVDELRRIFNDFF